MAPLARLAFALAAGTALLAQPPASGAVTAYLQGCRILGSLTRDNLTLVAVAAPPVKAAAGLRTLDAALAGGQVTVSETGPGGTVNTLALRNHGATPVFIMAGEILAGAKQDRILQQDVVIPGGGQAVQVPAFCVEHGRWSGATATFHSEKAAAPVAVRQAAQASRSQSAVWEEVAANNAAVASAPAAGSLSETYRKGRVVASRQGFQDALGQLPRNFPGAAGVVVVINGRVAGADLFRDPTLFGHLWGKLLDSYIAEAVRRDGAAQTGPADAAEAFLRQARQAQVDLGPTPGVGRQVALDAGGLKGAGVLLESPVHLDLFPVLAKKASAPPALQRELLVRSSLVPAPRGH